MIMNDIVSRINDISVTNTWKTHDLLDRVLEAEAINFPTNEIKFDGDHVAFVTDIDEYKLVVIRDLNAFVVAARAVKNGNVVAECTVTIDGQFNETYGSIQNIDIKHKISDWFTAIGNIDTTHLQGQYIGSEENVPDTDEAAEVTSEEEVQKVTAVAE
jgi:hypothetical protein